MNPLEPKTDCIDIEEFCHGSTQGQGRSPRLNRDDRLVSIGRLVLMGIYDRNYMRGSDDPADWWKPGYSIKRWLTIALIAVSLLTSIVWLGRSLGIIDHSKPPS